MDKSITADQVRLAITRLVEEAGGNKAWASANAVSRQLVSDIICGRAAVSAPFADRLGLKRVVVYVPKGS